MTELIDVLRQQIKNGRKETTMFTKKGIEEIEKFGMKFVDDDIKEIMQKFYEQI
jgi:ABC-type uncharacterized transport system ATPase subunit